jgi:hypothetical protein
MNNFFNESHNPTAKEIAVLKRIAQAERIQKRADELASEDWIYESEAAELYEQEK